MSTDTRTRVLAAITAEPGDWTPADIAEILGLPEDQVKRAVYALRRQERVGPRGYRLHAHVTERYGSDPVGLVPWYYRADAQRTALDLLTAIVYHEPVSAAQLAQILQVPHLTGAQIRMLRRLHDDGIVSPPACLWPEDRT